MPSLENQHKEQGFYWPRLILTVLYLFLFLQFFRPIEVGDGWWHLKTGEWIAAHHQVPHEDLFPFGNERTPWIFTQWFGSTLLYIVFKLGGLAGLKVFRALVFTGALSLFVRYALPRVGLSMGVALVVLLVPPLYSQANLRPDIFNCIFIQIFLAVLFRFQNTKSMRALWVLPLCEIVWGNMHLGSFVYGLPLIGIFVVFNVIELVAAKLRKEVEAAAEFWERSKALLGTLVCCLAALAISPYGYHAFLYPFKVFLVPDYLHIGLALKNIEEVASPLTYLRWDTGLWAIALILLASKAALENHRNRTLHLLLLLVSFGLFLHGIRASGFFGLVAAYVIVEASAKPQPMPQPSLNTIQKSFWVLLVIFFVARGFFFYNQFHFKDGHLIRNMSMEIEAANPRAALEFMKQNGLQGQVFNSDLLGGYIWSFYPQVHPFIDGRQLNQDRFVKFIHITQDPKRYWPAIASEFGFKVLLLDTSFDYTFSLIDSLDLKEWQMVYYDDASLVLVKRGAFSLPENAVSLERRLLDAQTTPKEKELLKDLAEKRQVLCMEPAHVDVLMEAKTLLRLGFKEAGFKRIVQASDIAPCQARKLLIDGPR
jgi:hypothetical protein